jgi:F-box and leucine-rich repeat protein GRR1
VHAFLRSDLEAFCRDAPQGVYPLNLHVTPILLLTYILPEFTPHQREVFCVFSGQGVTGLRRYLNQQAGVRNGAEFDDDEVTLTGDDDNHTMTGMMSATALNGGEEENEADEELEDAEDSQQGVGLGSEAQT